MASVESGRTYKLVNYKSGTVLDLSGTDNVTVLGFPGHGGTNQQWEVTNTGEGWTFKNLGNGRYLAIEGSADNGTQVVGSENEFKWDIKHDEQDNSAHRIFVHNDKHVVDLSDHGNDAPGTKVTLWAKANSSTNQAWKFEQV